MAREDGSLFYLDFEKPVEDIDRKIRELERFSQKTNIDLSGEIEKYRQQRQNVLSEIYSNLTPWRRVQVARHPDRPDTVDYINLIFSNFLELHGDRAYGDDKAVITGIAKLEDYKVMIVGQTKGKTIKEKQERYFGSMHPEGYRKALLKMKLAEKCRLPVITFINTPGAYPGIGAEERGQAYLIAQNLFEMSRLKTPIISVIIGEGGSGGALGICVANRILMMENSYLSVISPEGCAAILWRDSSKAPLAAEYLRLSPQELQKLGIVDEIIPEPLGGAHRDPLSAASELKKYLLANLETLVKMDIEQLLQTRYKKYREIGAFMENQQLIGKTL